MTCIHGIDHKQCGNCYGLCEESIARDLNLQGLGTSVHLTKDEYNKEQLNAFKAGMTEAAGIVASHWNDQITKVNQLQQALCSEKAILTARDNKITI